MWEKGKQTLMIVSRRWPAASVYVSGMSDGTLARSYGKVFNEVAAEYDRNRPAYPVFSASAIHWVDPDLGWRKIADALAPGGTLALIQYFGLKEQRSVDDQEDLLSALRRHAPEIAATWPTYRDLDHTIEGVRERRGNIAEAWAWLGSYDIGRDYAADLFDDLQLATVPTLVEHTAGELGALLGTMSFWARLSPGQRDAITGETHALHERLGRPIRASTLAALLTARRSAPAPQC